VWKVTIYFSGTSAILFSVSGCGCAIRINSIFKHPVRKSQLFERSADGQRWGAVRKMGDMFSGISVLVGEWMGFLACFLFSDEIWCSKRVAVFAFCLVYHAVYAYKV
jgi:hypothetical protein